MMFDFFGSRDVKSGGNKNRLDRLNRVKRIIDVATVLASAPLTLPLMLVVGVAIRVLDGAPVIFKQKRLGLNEKEFHILKFRTMRTASYPDSDRDRITPLGRLLRKSSLDELPQLLNICRGDMSLIGPRPLYPHYLAFYTEEERIRHSMRPGITGLAQVSGRNDLRWSGRLAVDKNYVDSASIKQDIAILVKTFLQLRQGRGVSVVARDTGEPLDVERSYPHTRQYAIRRFNSLDIDTRVEWMSSPITAKYMSLPATVSRVSTVRWYEGIRDDPWRDDFVVYDSRTEKIVCMLGLKSLPGNSVGTLYIFADPNEHGRGHGKTSLKLLLEWAKKSRYSHINLEVNNRNAAAIRLYDELGFTPVHSNGSRTEYSLAFR